ncbi:MAG: rhodanese-related sulfurtransferase [Candidatus Aldehydirespiratoraceae bacterium]|jgi:rhodanese-related sulfurtransferase
MVYRNHHVTGHASVINADSQFIDVRQPDEVAAGSIDGAINVPLDELATRVGEFDPGKRTVLLCRSGGRSAQAAEFLSAAGFGDVVNLDGGMLAYATEGTR